LFGYNVVTGLKGVYIVDVSADPMHPDFIDVYDDIYFHDGFVRNDTLWVAEIYDGRFEIFDIADKSNFISLGYAGTPALTTHNCEPSADGKYLFTTDEFFTGYIGAFDISDFNDIKLLDKIKHGDVLQAVPPNVHIKDNFLVASHYSEGVVIIDATRPETLVETGHFDTSPAGPDSFFEGAWEVYPYLSSGLLLVSDIQEGLFVLEPEYKRAAYLEGIAADAITFETKPNALVQIMGTDISDYTDLAGMFAMGTGVPGVYDIKISAEGCELKVFEDISLLAGETMVLNALLDCGSTAVSEIGSMANIQMHYQAENKLMVLLCDWSYPFENVYCRIFDSDGREVFKMHLPDDAERVEIPFAFPPGVYICSVQSGNSFWQQKCMVY
ncbi:MAG: hypothetical protein ACK4IY_01895, partial [Chitinophagales bacterium]